MDRFPGEWNGWLEAECERRARLDRHPELREKTVWEVYEAERAVLRTYAGPFNGFNASEVTASATCLVNFDPQQVLGDGPRRPQGGADQGLPSGSWSASTAKWWPSTRAPSAGTGPSTIPGATCRCW